jgi:hypothetical protein
MVKIKLPTKLTYFSSDKITHMEMIDKIYDFSMSWARLIGVNIFDKDFERLNKRIVSIIALTVLTFVINIYDIYIFRKDIVRCVFCIFTFSAEVQGFAMAHSYIWLFKNMINLRKKSEKFQEHFSSLKTSKILEENSLFATHSAAFLTFLGTGTFLLIGIYPIIYFLIFNERILHFGFELPFMDWKSSWIAYGINFVHQSCLLYVFVVFEFQAMCTIICLMTSGIGQYDVLGFLLSELNDLIIQNKDGSKNDEIRCKIKFLVETHLNLIQFLQELRDTFFIYYFIDLSSLVLQKTAVLFAIISVSCQKITFFS